MPKPKILLVLKDIRSTHNVGSIFRSADAFGVTEVLIAGYTPYPQSANDNRLPHLAKKINNQIAKTSLGAEQTVPFRISKNYKKDLQQLKIAGYTIASLEQSAKSIKLDSYKAPNKIALILGNELDGVDAWTLSISDVILEIEQYGNKESLNVANAASVALYALTSQK